MEGLTRLVEKVVESEDFNGFWFRDSYSVDILQFANDTMIFNDGSNYNLWCLKVVLRGFEIMSGLKVNFFKSNIYGFNIRDMTLNMASLFLACGVGSIPF